MLGTLHDLSSMPCVFLFLPTELFVWVRFSYDIACYFLISKTCTNVQLMGSGIIMSKKQCASINDLRATHPRGPRPSLRTSTFNFLYCRVVSRKSIRFTRMPSNARRAAWRFDALWAVPAQLVGSTALTDRKCLLEELHSLLKRDLVESPTFPTYTSYVELKFKLSDL